MPIDWPTILAFVAVEALFVLIAAPVLIQRRNEARAVAVFREKLLPLMPKAPTAAELAAAMPPLPVGDVVQAVRAELEAAVPKAPSAEEQAAARDAMVQGLATAIVPAVGPAVHAAIAEAVRGRMGALSAQAGESKATKALQESTLKARVGEKYGLKGLGALRLLAAADKDLYQLGLDAVSYAPQSLDQWLAEHEDKFKFGDDAKAGAKPKLTVL